MSETNDGPGCMFVMVLIVFMVTTGMCNCGVKDDLDNIEQRLDKIEFLLQNNCRPAEKVKP